MIARFTNNISQHRYKLRIIGLLAFASGICLILVLARVSYSFSYGYTGLVWNLFLAWIPFVLANILYVLSWRRGWIYFAIPFFALVWLIFFPNAPYILTDFQHLSQGATIVPLWYDVILLVWFSWTGMLLGIVSLTLMQEIINREFNSVFGWVFVIGVAALSSIGVYIGRFLRLNSWDIFQNPTKAASNLWDWLADPTLRTFGFIGLYTLFFIFVYLTIYLFGHLMQEEPHKS